MPDIKWRDIAQKAYKRYGEHVNWKNYQGLPMPKWGNLPIKIQEAWEEAVMAGHTEVMRIIQSSEERG